MINLTAQYPSQIFLPVATTQLINQITTIKTTGIINKNYPKKLRRPNIGTSPDGLGAPTTQIDVLINGNSLYAFQNFQDAQAYALQGATQMVNDACFYIENIPSPLSYYQLIVWGTV